MNILPMLPVIYAAGVPLALIVITILKVREFGFVTVGGFAENLFLAVLWPLALFSFALSAILTCEIRLWGRD